MGKPPFDFLTDYDKTAPGYFQYCRRSERERDPIGSRQASIGLRHKRQQESKLNLSFKGVLYTINTEGGGYEVPYF